MGFADSRLITHRDLLYLLVMKELKVKYKGTALGLFWSLLNPLLLMSVYTLVFSVIVRFQMPAYPVFLLSALLPWTAFAAGLADATGSIIQNAGLVRRIRLPIEIFPLTAVLSTLINSLPGLPVLAALALIYGRPLASSLLAIPLLLLAQALLTAGLALALGAVTVYFRDVQHLVGIATTVWFFATPILYPFSAFQNHHTLHFLLSLNPMTWVVVSYQSIWHDGHWPDPPFLGAIATSSIVAWLLGTLVFRRLEGRMPEEV